MQMVLNQKESACKEASKLKLGHRLFVVNQLETEFDTIEMKTIDSDCAGRHGRKNRLAIMLITLAFYLVLAPGAYGVPVTFSYTGSISDITYGSLVVRSTISIIMWRPSQCHPHV